MPPVLETGHVLLAELPVYSLEVAVQTMTMVRLVDLLSWLYITVMISLLAQNRHGEA